MRLLISAALSLLAGFLLLSRWAFPANDALARLIALNHPLLIACIAHTWTAFLFTTPMLLIYSGSGAASLLDGRKQKPKAGKLPPLVPPQQRESLTLVLGEVHQQRAFEPSSSPQWLTIPAKGLYTGVAIFGAVGSGKTSGCMYPYANQLLSWMAHDPTKKLAGLILEVKGDFCVKVKQIMDDCGRGSDYIELAFDRRYRYNPLHSDLSASALAFKIASLVNNLYGAGKEPFWQQAYTDLVTWIITLHRLVDGYLTMYDLFDCSIDQRKLQLKIEQGEEKFALDYVAISADDYRAHAELADKGFVPEEHGSGLITRTCPSLESLLAKLGIDFDLVSVLGTAPSDENARLFGECSKWLYKHWNELDLKLKTSIVAGLEVLVSPFPLNPELLYTLCPPKEMYDPVANADGRYGLPFPKFDDLIADGKVAALNFPIAADPAMSRLVATLMKMDFQSAMLRRIPSMTPDSRAALFLCDEYHELATAGLRDPSGDDHFFALSRQAKCIPIIATQGIASLQSALPHDSWRTVLQCFRTKVFLAMADDVSAKTAADLCGHAQQLKLNYTLSESGQDAKVSLFTGRTRASKASMGASKAYHLQRDFIFEPFVFNQLANAQSIVLAYDGDNPHPPTICYLKPYWLDPQMTWFEQREKGFI